MSGQSKEIPTLALEHVDAGFIGVDPAAGTIPGAMSRCLEVLTRIAVDPGKVRLVVTGDFVGSVRERVDDGPASDDFNLKRGSGMVAGKTMPRDDGSIDVLLPWWFFSLKLEGEHQVSADYLAVRTATHEAQHVAMRQNGQSFVAPAESSWRERNFTNAADSILDEYRAELGVAQLYDNEDSPWAPIDVLSALSRGIAVAVASYQEHLEVDRLAFELGSVCVVAWKAFAYMAAIDVHSPEKSPVASDVQHDPLWIRMGATSWPHFRAALASAPSGVEVMTEDAVATQVTNLAHTLAAWLIELGFTWTDTEFKIASWYFTDRDFHEAMRDQAS